MFEQTQYIVVFVSNRCRILMDSLNVAGFADMLIKVVKENKRDEDTL